MIILIEIILPQNVKKVEAKIVVRVLNRVLEKNTLAFFPTFLGAPEKSRTPNLQIRSLALYPIELRAQL